MNPEETHIAVGELVQAAAHQHGVVGPVPFTVQCNLCDEGGMRDYYKPGGSFDRRDICDHK